MRMPGFTRSVAEPGVFDILEPETRHQYPFSGAIMKSTFVFQMIGTLHTPHRQKKGVPIQGVFDPESRGRAVIRDEYAPGLQDIEGFSHLILLYVFDRSEGYDLVCKPYMEDNPHGVFSIRAPRRPNPIGFSVVRLEKREGPVLYLAELDMLDRTPLLDIKPFVPRFDHRQDVRLGWMTSVLDRKEKRTISDDRF
jgi:tRNA-Thr(GGU) m(6)t(6)A37 methyltransferase TsaA